MRNSVHRNFQLATLAPTTTTTYYAFVQCGNGVQCVDEVTVTVHNDPANCENPCEDEIAGSVQTDELNCSLAGIMVSITDNAGNIIDVTITDANGDYTLPNGPFICGEYIAMLDVASVPACYLDMEGDIGPTGFTVNGDGVPDGANFSSFNEVPKLLQWSLITFALLLMNIGALFLLQENKNFNKKFV